MAEILIVDDDADICAAFAIFLRDLGHTPAIASNAADAIAHVARHHPDLVFMDIRMPGRDGLDALPELRAADPDAVVLLMTAYGTSRTAIDAVRRGAYQYLTKPLDLDVMGKVIEEALRVRQLNQTRAAAPDADVEAYPMNNLVGQSPPMQEAYRRIGVLAGGDMPALIVGEAGVGKRLVARTIHHNSARAEGPMVAIACRNADEARLERELFGSAVVGAGETLRGKLEQARGGTVLLQDVDALPPRLQERLLRVLVDGTLERIGDIRPIELDVRVLGAAEQGLVQAVREGRFSRELAERLGVVSVELPPLRERAADVKALVAFFIARCNAEWKSSVRGIEPAALSLLEAERWPGNLAQLRSVISRACALSRGAVLTEALLRESLSSAPPAAAEPTSELERVVRGALHASLAERERRARPDGEGDSVFHGLVERVERELIREALALTSGNQVKTAELLGLNRTTLRKKMARDGLGE